MKKKYVTASLILAGFLFLFGCGGGSIGGAPGSDSGDTGITIRNVTAVAEDLGAGDHEIDVYLHYCDDELTKLEDGLYQVNATLTIDAEAIGFTDVFPASVEECTLTYLRGNENPDIPVIEELTVYPGCRIEEDEANECNFVMMDTAAKRKYWDDLQLLNLGNPMVHYVAQFDCIYVNQYGESGTFKAEYDIWLKDWDNC